MGGKELKDKAWILGGYSEEEGGSRLHLFFFLSSAGALILHDLIFEHNEAMSHVCVVFGFIVEQR